MAISTIPAAGLSSGVPTRAQLPAGSVLQVVSTTKTDTFTHDNGYTFTDVTGASVVITPTSATSKILVSYSCTLSQSVSSGIYGLFARVTRDGTVIVQGDARGSTTRAATAMPIGNYNYSAQHFFQYLDSPASTSALTYQLQVAIEAGSQIIVGGSWRTVNTYTASTPTIITVMEVAA
jgi:hypothetical protein